MIRGIYKPLTLTIVYPSICVSALTIYRAFEKRLGEESEVLGLEEIRSVEDRPAAHTRRLTFRESSSFHRRIFRQDRIVRGSSRGENSRFEYEVADSATTRPSSPPAQLVLRIHT